MAMIYSLALQVREPSLVSRKACPDKREQHGPTSGPSFLSAVYRSILDWAVMIMTRS